jgi:hypothetical protein
MPTPVEKIINVFHSKFQSKTELIPELEQQFLYNALADFEVDLYPLPYDESNNTFEKILSSPEVLLLGTLMYKAYLGRERDRVLKLNNIIGRDIKLTAMGNSKSSMNQAYDGVVKEATLLIDKLKDISFD